MDGWMYGQMEGWMYGCMDGWTESDGFQHACIHACMREVYITFTQVPNRQEVDIAIREYDWNFYLKTKNGRRKERKWVKEVKKEEYRDLIV